MGRRLSVSRPCSAHSCTAHFTVYIIYTYLAVYAYNIIIYCVYRYVLQRANVSFVVRSFIQFFSRSGRPCRMTRTFYRDPNSSTTSFSSSEGLFRTGVYILYVLLYILYLYTYVHTAYARHSSYNILHFIYVKTILYIPFVFNLIYIFYCARIYVSYSVVCVLHTIYYTHSRPSVPRYFVVPTVLLYNAKY